MQGLSALRAQSFVAGAVAPLPGAGVVAPMPGVGGVGGLVGGEVGAGAVGGLVGGWASAPVRLSSCEDMTHWPAKHCDVAAVHEAC